MSEAPKFLTSGRYCLPNGNDVPCTANIVTQEVFEIHHSCERHVPIAGTKIKCSLDNLGLIGGIVLSELSTGFTFRIVANDERRSRLEARVAWLLNGGLNDDQRKSVRIVPAYRDVQVILSGLKPMRALIADLSMMGAALLLGERPPVDAKVTVGKRFATVVRHTPDGIGIAFQLPFGPLTFNERVIL